MKKSLLLLILLIGCKPFIIKTVNGVKNPRIENLSTIKKYLHKKGQDTTNVYIFKNLKSFTMASKKKILSIPNAYFFDNEGNSVDYKKTTSDCNAKVGSFIDDLNSFPSAKKDTTKTKKDLEKLIQNSQNTLNNRKSDITVYITWAKYLGQVNKSKAFEWVSLIEKAKLKGVNIDYYLINCDFQESWEMTNKQIKNLGIKK